MRLHGTHAIWDNPFQNNQKKQHSYSAYNKEKYISGIPKFETELATHIEFDPCIQVSRTIVDEVENSQCTEIVSLIENTSESEYQPNLDGEPQIDFFPDIPSEIEFSSDIKDESKYNCEICLIIAACDAIAAPRYKKLREQDLPKLHFYNGRNVRRSPFLAQANEIDGYSRLTVARSQILSRFSKSHPKTHQCQICHMTFEDEVKHLSSKEHIKAMSQPEMIEQYKSLDRVCQDISSSFYENQKNK